MRDIHGIDVFTSVAEVLDPRHTLVVTIDVQRDFCSPGGVFDREGRDLSMITAMLPRLRAFLAGARAAGVPIVHVQQTALPGGGNDSPAWLYFKTRGGGTPDYAIDGTDGHGFVPGFEPLESETVVRKHRSSAFTGTPLAAMLASRGVRTVVCTGVTTQGCVESTARDALLLDFHPVVVADAVASTDLATHEASLLVQNARYDVVDGATVLEIWQRATGTTGGPRATEAAV